MTSAGEDDRGDAILAAEYALHLLTPAERAAFEARLEVEGALRAELAFWEEALVPLAADLPEVAPPRALRGAIETRLFGNGTRRRPAPEPGPGPMRRLFGGLLGAGFAAAVVVLLALQAPEAPPVFTAPFRAEMASADHSFVIQAAFDPDTREMEVHRVAGAAEPGRALELWLIPRGATTPLSLGVLPETPDAAMELPETLAAMVEGGTLAVSSEPPGGSPTGLPTGPVIALGQLAER